MYGDIIDLLEFIRKSPSPWHTASAASEQLLNAGFQELDWTEGWELQRYGRFLPLPWEMVILLPRTV